jgi:hypothetical protein
VILVDANGGNEKGENSPSTAKEFVDIEVVARPDDTIPRMYCFRLTKGIVDVCELMAGKCSLSTEKTKDIKREFPIVAIHHLNP